ncbi:SAM-dependent methyltransferase [Streptomyces sp. YIM 98790]|uniref:SAM-dependent methyltransferase n=1 Tax=Streptomyces sp. YIM 98790 TaxID=2689077 RepID=UPI001407B7B7|nr:SAM-dependent methyltransferase [Streptomyces sp. YIM 98790]
MTGITDWIPDDIDTSVPSPARTYDYLLGGVHNFPCDRQVAEQVLTVLPVREMSRDNREYLHRVVRFLTEAGITQFLDLGSGLPSMGNVHEVAQRLDPRARVVYVDCEPAAAAHGRLMLSGNEGAAMVCADIREPESVLDAGPVRALLDLSRPVALLMLGVTQFLPDEDDPWALTARYRAALAPGSYLALSSFTWDNDPEAMRAAITMFTANGRPPIVPRTRAEVLRLIGDFELAEPGLVFTPQWRPEHPERADRRSNLYAGVARKPR